MVYFIQNYLNISLGGYVTRSLTRNTERKPAQTGFRERSQTVMLPLALANNITTASLLPSRFTRREIPLIVGRAREGRLWSVPTSDTYYLILKYMPKKQLKKTSYKRGSYNTRNKKDFHFVEETKEMKKLKEKEIKHKTFFDHVFKIVYFN